MPGRRLVFEMNVSRRPGKAVEIDAVAELIEDRYAGEPPAATAIAATDRTASMVPAMTRKRVRCMRALRVRLWVGPRCWWSLSRVRARRGDARPSSAPARRSGSMPRLAVPPGSAWRAGVCGTAVACSSNQRSSSSLSAEIAIASPASSCAGSCSRDPLRSLVRYGSGASAAGSFSRVSPTSLLAGIMSEDTKSFAATGSKSDPGTPGLGSGELAACSRSVASCFSSHFALRAVPSMTVPCLSSVDVGGGIPVV